MEHFVVTSAIRISVYIYYSAMNRCQQSLLKSFSNADNIRIQLIVCVCVCVCVRVRVRVQVRMSVHVCVCVSTVCGSGMHVLEVSTVCKCRTYVVYDWGPVV